MRGRKFKFRVWNPDKKSMCYMHSDITIRLNGYLYSSFYGRNEEKYILQQWTGLKDINKKRIYEGDILECNGVNLKVYFEDGAFRVEYRIISQFILSNDVKVVGNIFETPELLK